MYWEPIQDLPLDWKKLISTELPPLVTVWNEQAERLRSSGEFITFMDRLRREIAIETGIIERLYSLDRTSGGRSDAPRGRAQRSLILMLRKYAKIALWCIRRCLNPGAGSVRGLWSYLMVWTKRKLGNYYLVTLPGSE